VSMTELSSPLSPPLGWVGEENYYRLAGDPLAQQRRAAAPDASVWVSASAGTGKTRVLTDRLLRLLLDGTDPAHILCLTFTRAAAAEMANRLNQELALWATSPAQELAPSLRQLTGRSPDEERMARARQLFARVLDTPGGVKIATIHSFCQSLLRRFPLEAGVSPEFAVLDERRREEALSEAVKNLLAAARDGEEPEIAATLAEIARHAPEERFGALMAALVQARGKIEEALADGHAALAGRLRRALALAEEASAEILAAEFCAGGDRTGLRAAAAALAAGSKTDCQRGAAIARWCEAVELRTAMIEEYAAAFLTDKGEIRKTLITKAAAAAAACEAGAILAAEAERVRAFLAARAAAAALAATGALVRLGAALLERYDRQKRREGWLDYDDLVAKALALLRAPGVAPWVLFKLDGGIDHILIDEAQDTNPEQWQIVAALAEEFFAGEDPHGRRRTVFAVGDAKQSIFSFQGTDPRAFSQMRRHFEWRVNAARQPWLTLPLELSFRSVAPVLQAVDAIFRHREAQDGVVFDGGEIRHLAARAGQHGLVEIWPPIAPDPEQEPQLPLMRQRLLRPSARLAAAIAATIRHWLDTDERLAARDRAIRPGDVMVLVRRRNNFLGELLRALKQRQIPVAGVDRLVLTEQLAVRDLIALGRFLLLPEDDLTLATVLKGPLFGIGEEALFDLAYDRGEESLWQRLRARAAGDPVLRRAAERLSALLARADFVPPYELYAEILGAGGGRRAVLERLGSEAADPVEEFLSLALAYERDHVPSLQGFLCWLDAGETEIKRDFAARERDEVRILTVHGAKGLEAPVVFLPDTMQVPNSRADLVWTEGEGVPLWRPRADFPIPAHDRAREALRRREMQEYRRLLYVALTRAQDRLYICGWQTRQALRENCWYGLCRTGLDGIAAPFDFDLGHLLGRDGWQGTGFRLSGEQTALPVRDRQAGTARAGGELPTWIGLPPPPEPALPKPLVPSRPPPVSADGNGPAVAEPGNEPAVISPRPDGGGDRFKRGLLIHRLLQNLPELPETEREAAARRFLAAPAHGLSAAEQDDIRVRTLMLLRHPDFAPLFGPGSLAEVPVVGLFGDHALSGQIDRLVVADGRVLIVDYKTLRLPPATEEEVPPLYLRQLALYRAALTRVYPGHEVRAALLFTEAPLLLPISPERLAPYLP
jgi:ATP-dependent helicase/nuclease subunit A